MINKIMIPFLFFIITANYHAVTIAADDIDDIRDSYIQRLDTYKTNSSVLIIQLLTGLKFAESQINEVISDTETRGGYIRFDAQSKIREIEDVIVDQSVENGYPLENQYCIGNASYAGYNNTRMVFDELMTYVIRTAGEFGYDMPLRHSIFDRLQSETDASYKKHLDLLNSCEDQQCLDQTLESAVWEYNMLELFNIDESNHLAEAPINFVYTISQQLADSELELENVVVTAETEMKGCCTCDCACPNGSQ